MGRRGPPVPGVRGKPFAHDKFHEDVAVSAAIKWLRARKSDRPLCFFVGTNWPHVPWPKDTAGFDPAKVVIPGTHVDTTRTREARAHCYAAIAQMDAELGEVVDAAKEVLGANSASDLCASALRMR